MRSKTAVFVAACCLRHRVAHHRRHANPTSALRCWCWRAVRSCCLWAACAGASYARLWPLLLVTAAVALWLPRRANALNALLLGESEANHLGINVEGLKRELAVALALGLGTMVGWRRVVKTIGEKIGKQGMTRSEERRVGKECRSRWSPYH